MNDYFDSEEFRISYSEDKHIDEENLHIEWLNQSDKNYRYVFYYAKCRAEEMRTRHKKEFMYAKLGHQIRKDPKAFDMEKATDKSVEERILIHPEYRQAVEEHINAAYEYGLAKGALDDMREMRHQLEGLNFLYNTGYFNVPEADRNIVSDRKRKAEFARRRKVEEDQAVKEVSNDILDKLNQ